MRLHHLELLAFGPFATQQRVDFERLNAGGLFLLEGPTGAGKTTVLDAITFALYGELSGELASVARLHSHFAPRSARPLVTLEFSVGGRRYRVTRSPEHERPKLRGEGMTKEKATARLERRDGDGWLPLAAQHREVADEIQRALGLSRAQFTQVVLLPQGEFARFLRASDDERREVLTRLFGTELYDRIKRVLEERSKAYRQRLNEASGIVDQRLAAAWESAEQPPEGLAEVQALGLDERHARLASIGEHLAERVEAASGALKLAREAESQAKSKHLEAAEAARRMKRLQNARAKLELHEGGRDEQARREGRLARAQSAAHVKPLVNAWREARALVEQAQEKLAMLAPDADEPLTRGEGAAALLDEAATLREQASALGHWIEQERGLPARRAELARLELAAASAQAKVAELEHESVELPGKLRSLEKHLEDLAAASEELPVLEARGPILEVQVRASRKLEDLEPELRRRGKIAERQEESVRVAIERYKLLAEARLRGMSAELASSLKEGAACPVCGSTEHPDKARPDEAAVTAEDVREADETAEKAKAEHLEITVDIQTMSEAVAEARASSGGRPSAELGRELHALGEAIKRARAAKRAHAETKQIWEETKARYDSIADALRIASIEAAKANDAAEVAAREVRDLARDLELKADGHASVASRGATLLKEAASKKHLGEVVDALARHLVTTQDAERRVRQEAAARGFGSVQEANAAALAPQELRALDGEVAAWNETLIGLRADVEAEELKGLDLADALRVHAAAAAALEAWETEGRRVEATSSEHESARGRHARFTRCLEELEKAEMAHSDLGKASEAIIRMDKLARGQLGHRHMDLTTFVLRQMFSEVVDAANLRLSTMSAGRYALERVDESDERKTARVGLTLRIVDRHTGRSRSPGSLSCGETFFTSLALALGLADVVKAQAGGVDLDTLFIDEGFGTLDPEALDQVMAVIDELRERGRLVGIVSHVLDLKDRVAERIEVRRLPDGSSSLTVVA
jgi:DNA repair protein SbcC/Rad50